MRRKWIQLCKKYEKLIPLLDQAIVSGGNFLIGIILTRVLGLQSYGEYSLLWLLVLFASSIQHAGILTPMYTFAPQLEKEKQRTYLHNLLALQLSKLLQSTKVK